jgi:6-pyruvoyl-tetrahydropterin synthase
MYPYKINWTTESLEEIHEDNSYGYVNDLLEIKKIIYKYIDKYINEYENNIKNEIKDCGTITLERFYEMVNSEPYWDFIFLSVKYFDFTLKTWKEYEVNEKELNDYFLSRFNLY